MADVSEMYASPWLTADDLRGAAHNLIIREATIGQFANNEGVKEPKAVLAFRTVEGQETKKKLIVNKSQYKALVLVTGSSMTEAWVGKQVTLSPTTAQNGKLTIGISGTLQVAEGAVAF